MQSHYFKPHKPGIQWIYFSTLLLRESDSPFLKCILNYQNPHPRPHPTPSAYLCSSAQWLVAVQAKNCITSSWCITQLCLNCKTRWIVSQHDFLPSPKYQQKEPPGLCWTEAFVLCLGIAKVPLAWRAEVGQHHGQGRGQSAPWPGPGRFLHQNA